MAKRKYPTTSELKNTTIVDSSNYRDKALRLKKDHDKLESKQKFQVVRIDAKTTIYKRVPEGEKVKGVKIHKGRI